MSVDHYNLIDNLVYLCNTNQYTIPNYTEFDYDVQESFNLINVLDKKTGKAEFYVYGPTRSQNVKLPFGIEGLPFIGYIADDTVRSTVNRLTDYYQYKAKYHAYKNYNKQGQDRPLPKVPISEIWTNPTYRMYLYRLLLDTLKSYDGEMSLNTPEFRYHLWDQIHEQKLIVSAYSPSFMVSIVDALGELGANIESLFDPFAGWGDRLLAAIRMEIPYEGTDPNVHLIDGYRAIMEDFAGGSELQDNTIISGDGRYRITITPFEDYTPSRSEGYDAIITSPPYYDQEVFTKTGSTQSISRYPSRQQWDKIYTSWITKCMQMLNDNGYLVIQVNDTPTIKICAITITLMKKLGSYMGNIVTIGRQGKYNNNNFICKNTNYH